MEWEREGLDVECGREEEGAGGVDGDHVGILCRVDGPAAGSRTAVDDTELSMVLDQGSKSANMLKSAHNRKIEQKKRAAT